MDKTISILAAATAANVLPNIKLLVNFFQSFQQKKITDWLSKERRKNNWLVRVLDRLGYPLKNKIHYYSVRY